MDFGEVRMDYGKKLQALRERIGISQVELARFLKIDKSLYGRYEKETQTIPMKHLISLANYFNISIDYLFSFNENLIYDNMHEVSDKINIGIRLKEFRKENNITQEKLAEFLHTNRSLLSNYEKGIYLISTSFLYDICKKYKVSADYLLGRIDSPKYLK